MDRVPSAPLAHHPGLSNYVEHDAQPRGIYATLPTSCSKRKLFHDSEGFPFSSDVHLSAPRIVSSPATDKSFLMQINERLVF